jgi:hypothetical protein
VRIRGVPGADRPLVQWLLVASCVLIVGLAIALVKRDRAIDATVRQLRQDLDAGAATQLNLERQLVRERSAREAFEIGLGRERAANSLPGIPLQPGLNRSGRPTQEIRIPPDASRVQLVLPLGSKRYERYRAALRPWTGGDELWVHAMLRPAGDPRRLFVAVPVDVLSGPAYELSLSGIRADGRREEIAIFTFEVGADGSGR